MRVPGINLFLTGTLLFLFTMACTHRQDRRRIIFFGDSITQEGVEPGGYIDLLNGLLQRHGLDDSIALIGAGGPGNTINDLYARLATDVLAEAPEIVVIYVGINDVWHKRTYGAGTDAAVFEQRYQDIIDALAEQGIRTVLCTPSVIGERGDKANPQDEDLDRYSDIVRALARKNGLALVDLRTAFLEHERRNNPSNKETGVLTTDGVHLNAAGNRLVAEAMWSVLQGELVRSHRPARER